MKADEYALKNGMTIEAVVEKIKKGDIDGYCADGVWSIGKDENLIAAKVKLTPIYQNDLGVGVLDFTSAIILILGIVAAIFASISWGIAVSAAVLIQAIAIFAIFKGLSSVIKLLKYQCAQMDR